MNLFFSNYLILQKKNKCRSNFGFSFHINYKNYLFIFIPYNYLVWNVHAISMELNELHITFFFTKMDEYCIYFSIDFIHVQLIFYVTIASIYQKKCLNFVQVLLI